jgi:glycosyltransferase involved in cell wall biosynthesis
LFVGQKNVAFVPDAASADAILADGRVLVNPILSGSGVNVKSIEMLRYDAPIVTTAIGVQGFPTEMHGQFIVREDAAGFAAAISEALDDLEPPAGRAQVRAMFGQAGVEQQIADYARIVHV